METQPHQPFHYTPEKPEKPKRRHRVTKNHMIVLYGRLEREIIGLNAKLVGVPANTTNVYAQYDRGVRDAYQVVQQWIMEVRDDANRD